MAQIAHTLIILILFVFIGTHPVNGQQEETQIILGTAHTLHSDILNEDREYWISLPESYDTKGMSYKRYPLLIILDGHAHFKSVAGMVNYMSSGYNGNRRIPEMIVVAVQNVNRNRDFTPDKIITTRPNDFGGGDKFLSFLEQELIPRLDQDLRTEPYRILFGHSLGGLLAAHVYMKENSLFNAFIAVDPSFGSWDAETMDKKLDALTEQSFNRFIYIATANWGKRNIRNRDRHVRFYESLRSRCAGDFPGHLEYFPDEDHGSVPVIAFYHGISNIFDGYGISYRSIRDKAELLQHFQALSQRLSWNFMPPEALINRIGYRLLRSNQEDEQNAALDFFQLNTEYYPGSFNAFDSLGEAYEILGDVAKAITNYEKSLALNPENEHASTRLKILQKR